jgi:hypothetical protein
LPAGFAGLHLATGGPGGPGPCSEPFTHDRDLAWPEPVSCESLVVDVVELPAGVGEVARCQARIQAPGEANQLGRLYRSSIRAVSA